MKNKVNLLKRIAAGLLSMLMVAAPVIDTGVQFGTQFMPSVVAVAASNNEADGSKIENIKIFWVTEDSTTDCKGQTPDGYWASSVKDLYVAAPTVDPVSMKYQVEVAFSGQYDYEPGDIVLRIPAQVIHGRQYDASNVGIVDPTVFVDTLALPVPQAPSTKAEFNWTLEGDEYVITNTSTVGATSTATFQFTIENVNPLDVVDMAASEPVSARVEVTTNQGNLIYLESDKLNAYVDTYSHVKSAYKSDNNGDLHDGVPVGVPEELLANLPAGTDPSDYVYVGWYSYVYHEGSQPFTLKAVETESAAYLMNGSTVGQKVVDGIFLGWRDVSPIPTDNEKEIIFFENDYCEDTKQNFEHTIYCWTAYPRDQFEYADEDDATKNYRIFNTIDWIVEEADGKITAPITDNKEESVVPATAHVDFAPMQWEKPTGHFEVFKYTEIIYDKDHNYGFGLNQLLLGMNTDMRFWIRTVGYGYPWTTEATFTGNESPAEDPEEYGIVGWRQAVEDYQTFFDFDGVPLTYEDYQITAMEIRNPYLYRYGITSTGACGYERDASLPVPDLKIEYMDENGMWHYAGTAQWGTDGKGQLTFVELGEGVTAKATPHQGNFIYFPENAVQTRHTFVSNVFGGQTVSPCEVAAVEWDVFDHIQLKPSAKVVAVAERLMAEDDNASTKFKNDVRMDVDGWVGLEQSPNGQRLNDEDTFYDSSRATISGTSYGVTMDKSLEYDAVTDNDTVAQQAVLHYSANVYEQSNLTDPEEYSTAVANNIIPAEESGIWYDLLPPGVVPKLDTITLRENDTIISAYTIPNYKNTGRILLVVEADLTPVPEYTDDGYQDVLTLKFDAVYPWSDARTLGQNLNNYIAFESTSDLPGGMLGSVENETGEPDNPRGGMNTTTPQWNNEIANAMTDLDPTTDENRFVYGEAQNVINVNMYALSGLAKSVSNDLVGLWTQGLDGQDQVTVYEGQKYTYRLKVSSTDQTQTKDIILYDSIENYDIPDPADDEESDATKAADFEDRESKKDWFGDWQGKGQWRGTLLSVDASEFVAAGAAPVLYYSTVENLQFEDTSPNPSDAEMDALVNSGYYVLEGNSAWNRVELDASGKWTVPAGVNVTAIAIDASKDAAGADFVLMPGEDMTAYLHMVAPDDNGDPDAWHAKGAYAHNGDLIDWEAAGDAENNMYAFNNARIISTQSDASSIGASHRKMTRNDYTRVGIIPGQVSVVKVWNDDNDHDGLRPDAATVTLMRKPVGTHGAFSPVEDPDGAPLTAELNEGNEWKYTFLQVDVVDENGTPYLYTFTEEPIEGYTYTVKNTGDTEYTITNTHLNEKVTIEGHKYWVDNDNMANTRPAYIMVNLLRDGESIKSMQVKPNSNGDWVWKIEDLDKYEAGGREYEYTVTENYVSGYVPTYDDSSYDIINTYSPYGALEISKAVSGGTEQSSQKEFTFTLVLLGKEGAPLMDPYPATLLEEQNGSWVELSTTTVTCNSTFTLKGNQKLLVENLPTESTYRVSEGSAAGYSQQSAAGAEGTIITNETAQAAFVNAYSASGSVSLAATKVLNGGALRKGQFSFQMVDITEGGSGTVYSGFNQAGEAENGASTGAVQFATISYTGADVGKTFVYQLSEVNDGAGGITYSDAVYTATVTVEDNGDGTLAANVVYKDASGAVVDVSDVKFENEYAAEGSTSVMAWKVLNGGTLAADQFEFGLYEQGNSTPVATAKNNADGEIVFENLTFTSDDLSADPENPAVITYEIKEIVPANADDDLEYDDTVYTVSITLKDNGDGTIGFEQQYKDATGADATPVFTNAAKPGNLKVEKHIEGDVVDPDQEFTFKVRFTGEGLPEEIEYELSEASPTTSQLIREQDGLRSFVAAAGSVSPSTGYYTMTDAEIAASTPIARLSADGKTLTFLRGTSEDGKTYTLTDGNTVTFDYAFIHTTATTDGTNYWRLTQQEAGGSSSQQPSNWAYISSVEKIEMLDGFKPNALSNGTAIWFDGLTNLKEADLSKMDTSNLTSLSKLFNGNTQMETLDISTWNVSNVTDMNAMFLDCKALNNLDISKWRTPALTTANNMFKNCYALETLNVANFNTSNITSLTGMFQGCTSLGNLDMSGWDTSKVTNFSFMFAECCNMSRIDVSSFNTKSCTDFRYMFYLGKMPSNYTTTPGTFSAPPEGRELILGSNFDTSKALSQPAVNTQGFVGSYTGTFGTTQTVVSCFDKVTISDTTRVHSSNTMPGAPGNGFGDYTGHWVMEGNPSAEPVSNKDLFQEGGHAGTWIWEVKEAAYTLNFLPGDGATGTMSPMEGVPAEALTVTNGFKRFGYNFAGFVDETGNEFAVNTDGKTVTIPANTYADGTHTLTAQWTKIDTNVEIVDGVLTFTLHDGEAATFPNLPAGTTYEVWEETPSGWELVNSTNTEGTIPSNQTVTATFYNEYNEEITGVDVVLRASKLMDGEVPEAEQFSFLLTYPDGTTTQTKSNSASGAVVFDAITFDTAGEYVYKITEVKGNDNSIKYDNTTYLATVKVENVDGQLSATVKYRIQYGSQLSAPPVFQNTSKPGTLWISKQVSGAPDIAKDTEFTVQMSFTKDNQPWSGTIKHGNNDVVVTNGVCTMKIKGSSSIGLSNIPAGVKYEVKEIGTYPGWTLDTDVETGTIAANVNTFLTFTNTYAATGSYVITAQKQLDGRTLTDGEFTFGLYKNGSLVETVTNSADGSIRFSQIDATSAGTVNYVIKELPGSDSTIEYDGGSVDVAVVLTDDGQGRLVPAITYTKKDKNGTATGSEAVFTNDVKPGSISIDKTVVGATANSQSVFNFTMALTDAEGAQLTDAQQIGYAYDQGTGTVSIQGSTVSFTLEDGQKITFSNLTDGTQYTITEEAAPGFTTTSTGATGQVAANEESTASFTNSYDASGEYSFAATKNLTGKELAADQFTFMLMDESGYALQSATNAADGSITFSPLYFTLDDVGTKTYKVSERNSGVAGYTYDSTIHTITLNIVDAGDGTLTITDNLPAEGITFDNTYSNETEFTVSKKWLDNSNQYGLRPESIIVTLMQNGQPMTDYTNFQITGAADSDEWTYTFENLPSFDEATNEPYVYTVAEQEVPGYASSKVTDENGTTITNAALGMLSLTKYEQYEDTSLEFEFQITFTRNGQPYTEDIDCLVDGATETLTAEDGVYTVYLAHDENIQLIGLPIGMEYTIEETPEPYYVPSIEGDAEGTIQRGNNAVVFNNDYTAVININKVVLDHAGNELDVDDPRAQQDFSFQLTLTDPQGEPLTMPLCILDPETWEYTDDYINSNGGVYEFTLSGSEYVTLAGMPVGTRYQLVEEDCAGYTQAVAEDSSPMSGTLEYDINSEYMIDIYVENTFSAEGTFTIPGTKLVDGVPATDEVFQFVISSTSAPNGGGGKFGASGLVEPEAPSDVPTTDDWELLEAPTNDEADSIAATVNNDGSAINFGEIVFNANAIGDQWFMLYEVPDNTNNYAEDLNTFYVHVKFDYPVDGDGNYIYDGTLVASIIEVQDGTGSTVTVDDIEFDNTLNDVSAEFEKVWSNIDGTAAAPVNATVTFELLLNGTATGKTVTLDGTADTAPTGNAIAGYEYEPWKVKFVNLPNMVNVEKDGVVVFTEAEYTVQETAGYTGYTGTVSQDGSTVTNTQDSGSLKITKTATGNTVPAGATFTITGPNNYNETVTYAQFTNGVYTLSDLPVGTYTVTENATSAAVANYSLIITGSGSTAAVEKDGTAEVSITHTYTQDVGSLKITKTVVGAPTDADLSGLSFTITGPDGYSETVTYADFGNGAYTLDNLPVGEYTVTEDEASAAVTNYTLVVTGSGSTAEVEKGGTAEVAITNTYTQDVGSLTITKTVVGAPADADLSGLSFTITGPDGYSETVTYANFENGVYTLDNLPVGEYTVTEDEASAAVTNYTLVVTGSGSTAEVEKGGTAEVAITNTYTQDVGSLKITKTVNGAPADANLSGLSFTITGPNGYSETVTYADFENGVYTLDNLPVGEYTVTEDEASAAVTNYTLTVTGNDATVQVPKDDTVDVTIENTYVQDVGNLTITKTFEGAPADTDLSGLSFTITGPDGYSETVTYADFENGAYTLDNLPVGEYTVTEDEASAAVTNYTLVVTGSGSTAEVEKGGTAEVAITNTYTQDVGSLKITKTFEGTPVDADLSGLSFTISDGTTETTITYADFNADGEYVIENIPVETVYTVTETNAEGLIAGYVFIAGSSTTEGTATISKDEVAEIELVNTYEQYEATGEITFKGNKTIDGRALNDDDAFTFGVFEDGTEVVSGTSDVTGRITFDTIEYEVIGTDDSMLGEHIYTVKETSEDGEGITVDTNEYTVKVNVADNGDGTLSVTVLDDFDDPMALDFVNIYEAETRVDFTATKELDGRALAADQFSFELSGTNLATQTVTNDADGNVVFDPIVYTEDDAGMQFTYTLKEKTDAAAAGYTYDETVYTIQVLIVDDGKGNLTAEVTVKTAEVTGLSVDDIVFSNTYEASGSLALNGSKTVNGEAPAADEDALFSFRLLDGEGNPLQTVQNDNGTFTFEDLAYTEDDAGKTYQYKVIESSTTGSGYTLDDTEYAFSVTVTDNGDGTMLVTPTGMPAGGFAFDNTYEAEGELALTAQKLVNDETPEADQVFSFELIDEDGNVLQTKENVGETITFDAIPYTLEDVGEIVYTVKEATATSDTIKADDTEYTITVTIADNRNGTLAVTSECEADGEAADEIVFRNVKFAPLTISKTVVGSNTDTAFSFKVELTNADGSECTDTFTYTVTDASGTQVGEAQSLVSGGTIALKDGESAVISNTLPGTQYKVEEVENIAYTVKTNGQDGNAAEGTLPEEGAAVAFENTRKTTSLSVTKVWEGGYGGTIELVLYANGEKLESQPVYSNDGDTYSYANLPMYSDDGTPLTYAVKEKYMDGFMTIYVNEGEHESESNMVYDGGTIINRAATSIRVRKIWNGIPDGQPKPAITLHLYCNGTLMNKGTPTPDDDGWYEFKNLPVVYEGEQAVYTVVEVPMDGFTVTYLTPDMQEAPHAANGYTIVNTRVPDTGDDTPVGMLSTLMLGSGAGLGLLLLGYGISKRKKRT